MLRLPTVLFFLIQFVGVKAQDSSLYAKHWYISNGDTLPYRIMLPEGYDEMQRYPLVFFLHGAGERGSDNEKQLTHGSGLFAREDVRAKYPAIVVFPQCPRNDYWSNVNITTDSTGKRHFNFREDGPPTKSMTLAMGLLKQLILDYGVDRTRIYAVGLSMGGMGTFEIVRRNPGLFAAAVPICGGAHTATAEGMKDVSWWVFHGGKDDIVPPVNSRRMVSALYRTGANIWFTQYANANHNSWDPAFKEPVLLTWLFRQKRVR